MTSRLLRVLACAAFLVAARRYPIVDEEAGVVLAIAVFVRKPGTTTRRNALSEWFVIDNNKIRSIDSAMFYPSSEVVPETPSQGGSTGRSR